jgi:ABC-type thiamine transport system substrate-binding protein
MKMRYLTMRDLTRDRTDGKTIVPDPKASPPTAQIVAMIAHAPEAVTAIWPALSPEQCADVWRRYRGRQ